MCTVTQQILLRTFTSSGKGEWEMWKSNVHRDMLLQQSLHVILFMHWILRASIHFPASCSNLRYAPSPAAAVFTSWFLFLLSQSVRSCHCVISTVPHNKPHTQQLRTSWEDEMLDFKEGFVLEQIYAFLLWVNIHISNRVLNIFFCGKKTPKIKLSHMSNLLVLTDEAIRISK